MHLTHITDAAYSVQTGDYTLYVLTCSCGYTDNYNTRVLAERANQAHVQKWTNLVHETLISRTGDNFSWTWSCACGVSATGFDVWKHAHDHACLHQMYYPGKEELQNCRESCEQILIKLEDDV